MANIRVTCPACKSELELDAAFEGQEVECGSCLEVFRAKGPGSSSPGKIPGAGTSSTGGSGRGRPADRPPPKSRRRDDDDDDDRGRRRRRDEDDDDYDYAPPPPRSAGGTNALAVASLVLGILSITMVVMTLPFACCCAFLAFIPMPLTIPLSLAATITGAFALRNPEGKPMAIIGIVLGALSLGIVVLQLALGAFWVAPMVPPPQQR